MIGLLLTGCGPKEPQTVEEIIEALRSDSQEEQLPGVQALLNMTEPLTHSECSDLIFPLFGTLLGTNSVDWMVPGGFVDRCELGEHRSLIEESMPEALDTEWGEDILQRLQNCP